MIDAGPAIRALAHNGYVPGIKETDDEEVRAAVLVLHDSAERHRVVG